MDDIPLATLAIAIVVLLASSGFFSIAETAMMAANRHRLRHRAHRGERGAKQALALLGEIDKLLGVILLGNTLVAAAAATLAAEITKRMFGDGELPLALGTLAITFAILVFAEISPKVVGAAHADRIAPAVSYVLTPMLKLATPIVWFVNLFVQGLLRALRIRPVADTAGTLSQEELRSLVLEGQYFRGKHRSMLANLLDVEVLTVDDVMTPRNQIHYLDLSAKRTQLAEQLATSYHSRLPAGDGGLENVAGVVHLKHVVQLQQAGEVDAEHLREILRPPYFIPAGTPLLTQLQQFQTDRQRLGLVVDEYGELQGLVTIEDIIEEIIGDFTTSSPGGESYRRDADGSITVDGMTPLRALNRKLGTEFPLEGPKTLNGLIVEQLGEIPDAGTRVRVAGQAMEILQTQDRAIKVVRLLAPVGRLAAPPPPLQSGDGRASSSG
jgi:Mg2+/Co2+ transporter CorB